jgi:hypothetical protein
MATRFQSHIRSRPFDAFPNRVGERFNFSVWSTKFPMIANADLSIFINQNAAHHRIRLNATLSQSRQSQRFSHPMLINLRKFRHEIVLRSGGETELASVRPCGFSMSNDAIADC